MLRLGQQQLTHVRMVRYAAHFVLCEWDHHDVREGQRLRHGADAELLKVVEQALLKRTYLPLERGQPRSGVARIVGNLWLAYMLNDDKHARVGGALI